jgi:hypothetical protein
LFYPFDREFGWEGGPCRHGFDEPIEAQAAPCCDFSSDLARLSFEEVKTSLVLSDEHGMQEAHPLSPLVS